MYTLYWSPGSASLCVHWMLIELGEQHDKVLVNIEAGEHRKPEYLEQFIAAFEDLGQELGVQRVILPVYLRYWNAYSTLIKCGYQIDFTMVRMQRGKPEDFEDPTHLVLDDWR